MSPKNLSTGRGEAETRGNREGRGHWDLYAKHRAEQTACLLQSPSCGRLALLGAGNANDLDLAALTAHFDQVHLVDIDAEALAHAATQVSGPGAARLHRHAGLDLTGVLPALDARRRKGLGSPVTFADVESILEPAANAVSAALPGPFDCVASCCILTQLFFGVSQAVSRDDPQRLSLQTAAIVVHLRNLVQLIAPGGFAWLFSDVVSSETFPVDDLLGGLSSTKLLEEIERLGAAPGVLFDATNPIRLRRIMRQDKVLRQQVAKVSMEKAWLWTGPLARSYLVYAMRIWRA